MSYLYSSEVVWAAGGIGALVGLLAGLLIGMKIFTGGDR